MQELLDVLHGAQTARDLPEMLRSTPALRPIRKWLLLSHGFDDVLWLFYQCFGGVLSIGYWLVSPVGVSDRVGLSGIELFGSGTWVGGSFWYEATNYSHSSCRFVDASVIYICFVLLSWSIIFMPSFMCFGFMHYLT